MWPYMGSMGWWMVLWWVAGIVVLVLLVRLVAGTTGGFSPRSDETPEQILKRRCAKGEMERDEYQRRLEDPFVHLADEISPLGVTSTRIQSLEGTL